MVFLSPEACLNTVRLEATATVISPVEAPSGTAGNSPYAVEKFSCYPNPTYGDITAVFKALAGGRGELIVSDGLLRPLYRQEVSLDKGLNEVRVNTQGLPAGLLIVTIRTEDGTFYQRVVKES
jgi:hypothetical protein